MLHCKTTTTKCCNERGASSAAVPALPTMRSTGAQHTRVGRQSPEEHERLTHPPSHSLLICYTTPQVDESLLQFASPAGSGALRSKGSRTNGLTTSQDATGEHNGAPIARIASAGDVGRPVPGLAGLSSLRRPSPHGAGRPVGGGARLPESPVEPRSLGMVEMGPMESVRRTGSPVAADPEAALVSVPLADGSVEVGLRA